MNSPFELPKLKCLRCTHEWIPRKITKPHTCPNCKSPYWDMPRRVKAGGKPEGKENSNS